MFLYSAVDNAFITDVYRSHYAQAEDSNDKERPAGPFRNNIECPERKHPPFTRNQTQSFCICSRLLSIHFAKIMSEAAQRQRAMIGFDFISRLKAWFFGGFMGGGWRERMHGCEF